MGVKTKRKHVPRQLDGWPDHFSTREQAAALVEQAFDEAAAELHRARGSRDDELTQIRRQLERPTTTRKCCRSRPRCRRCPAVVHRLRQQEALRLDDAALRAALARARKW